MLNFAAVAIPDLSAQDEARMFDLFAAYYDDVDSARFASDLRDKHQVLLMRDEAGRILGFTTLRRCLHTVDTVTVQALFSGDTIIHHEHWGQNDLYAKWLRLAGSIWAERPDMPLYWFLIVKGHRTYRYLSTFAHDYFPRHDPDPATESTLQRIAYSLARERFGGNFDPRGGVIRFPNSLGHLKGSWADVPERLADRPEIRFFLGRNPDFRSGVEMVCLAELSAANIKPFGRRFFEDGVQSGLCAQHTLVHE